MSLLLLVPLSIGMGLAGLAAFVWALRHGQFEDPDGAAWRIVTPQDPPPRTERPDTEPAGDGPGGD